MDETIPSKSHAKVAHELNNAIGFVVSEADRIYGLPQGETALFWHIVSVVARSIKKEAS